MKIIEKLKVAGLRGRSGVMANSRRHTGRRRRISSGREKFVFIMI